MNERITQGEGKHKVWLEQNRIGDDMFIILGGGEKPHIGGVVLKVPGEDIRVVNIGTHRDFHVLIPIAEKVCEKYGVIVVVAGGVHIDNATKDDIDIIVRNCEILHSML